MQLEWIDCLCSEWDEQPCAECSELLWIQADFKSDRGYKNYKEFLKSLVWVRTRAIVLRRYGHRCANSECNATAQLEVHHVEYPGNFNWGSESISDLICVCHDCHQEIHQLDFYDSGDSWAA